MESTHELTAHGQERESFGVEHTGLWQGFSLWHLAPFHFTTDEPIDFPLVRECNLSDV